MQPGGSFRLIVRRGPQPNQQYELNRDTMTIGRDITNDITINDPEVSRHHSRLVRNPGGYTIEDLRSTNGTFVNRQRLTGPYQLSNGDLIGLGETVTLVYEVAGAGQSSTVIGAGGGTAPPPPAPVVPQPAYGPGPVAPPVADEYDYYEDEEGIDRNRLIVIGCGVLTFLFICSLIVALIIIDQANLYCDLPLGPTIFDCGPSAAIDLLNIL